MFFVFPFRIKNPPENMPWMTFTLIGLNVLVYAFTTQYFLIVRDDAVDALALTHATLSPWRLLTSMFLHAHILHIAGNMWFLWLFGAAVEGRLGPWRYLALYLVSGAIGGLLHDVVVGIQNPDLPMLGASGAVMGLAGAYLYTFPYAPVRFVWFYWIFFVRAGIGEFHAMWAVVYLLGMDILNGLLSGGHDGVGHLVHIGGAATGLVLCGIMAVKRDPREFAEAKAMGADLRDVDLHSLFELETMLQNGVTDVRVVIAYCEKALIAPGMLGESKCFQILMRFLQPLALTADQRRLASIVLRLPADYSRQIPPAIMLQIASNVEHLYQHEFALRVYRRLYEVNPVAPETEVALNRAGHIAQSAVTDFGQARHYFGEQLRLFPAGYYAHDAVRQMNVLPAPQPGFYR